MTRLGKFEQAVLRTILSLRNDTYGVPLQSELTRQRGKEYSSAQLYTTLERLEAKGMLSSRLSEARPIRGGRARKFFSVTEIGIVFLKNTCVLTDNML
jgi:DNA-binding PadR family transcriptional regulator